MSKRSEYRLAVLVLLGTAVPMACACGPSFSSVKTAAGLGTQLSTNADSFDALSGLCTVANNSTTEDSKCAGYAADAKLLHPVTDAIVAYAKALAAMADDSKDPDYSSNVSGTLKNIAQVPAFSGANSGDVPKITSGIANFVLTLCTDGYRRKHLRDAISKTDESWGALGKAIDGLAEADLRELASYRSVLSANVSALNGAISPTNVAARYAQLPDFVAVDAAIAKIQGYKKAVDDFVSAHHKLATKADTLGDSDTDKELLQEILKGIGGIVSPASASASSKAPPAGSSSSTPSH